MSQLCVAAGLGTHESDAHAIWCVKTSQPSTLTIDKLWFRDFLFIDSSLWGKALMSLGYLPLNMTSLESGRKIHC